MPPPRLPGVAVNVTLVFAQTAPPGFAVMLTEGVTDVVTTMVIVLLVAVVELRQVPFVMVMVHSTWSLFTQLPFVYVAEFVPTLPPFRCH